MNAPQDSQMAATGGVTYLCGGALLAARPRARCASL